MANVIAPMALVSRTLDGAWAPKDSSVELKLKLHADSSRMPRQGFFEVLADEHQSASDVTAALKAWSQGHEGVERTTSSPDKLDTRDWRVVARRARVKHTKNRATVVEHAKAAAAQTTDKLAGKPVTVSGVSFYVDTKCQAEWFALRESRSSLSYPLVLSTASGDVVLENAEEVESAYRTVMNAVGQAVAEKHAIISRIAAATSVKQVEDATAVPLVVLERQGRG